MEPVRELPYRPAASYGRTKGRTDVSTRLRVTQPKNLLLLRGRPQMSLQSPSHTLQRRSSKYLDEDPEHQSDLQRRTAYRLRDQRRHRCPLHHPAPPRRSTRLSRVSPPLARIAFSATLRTISSKHGRESVIEPIARPEDLPEVFKLDDLDQRPLDLRNLTSPGRLNDSSHNVNHWHPWCRCVLRSLIKISPNSTTVSPRPSRVAASLPGFGPAHNPCCPESPLRTEMRGVTRSRDASARLKPEARPARGPAGAARLRPADGRGAS